MVRMRAEDRRRQLLEVASELFSQRGYRGTTTAELARAAGITEPILYRHFQNKLDLFVTLIDVVSEEVIAAWRTALADVEDGLVRLRTLLAANPATHERGRKVYRVIFQAMAEHESDPTIGAALRRHLSRLHAFIRDEVTRFQEQNMVRTDETADALAWLLIEVAIGHGMVSPLGVPGRSRSLSRTSMQRLVEDLLVTTPPTSGKRGDAAARHQT